MNEASAADLPAPIPRTDDEVLALFHPFVKSLADAIAATAAFDEVITLREYQAVSKVAARLARVAPLPGLLSTLILRAIVEGPQYSVAMRTLRRNAGDRSETERLAVFEAVVPLIGAQYQKRPRIAADWAAALSVKATLTNTATDGLDESSRSVIISKLMSFRTQKRPTLAKARRFAATFQDDILMGAVAAAEASKAPPAEQELSDQLNAAVERVFQRTAAALKSQEAIDQQINVTERFLKTAEALSDQIKLRLQSIRDRLQLQSQMFREDLEEFVHRSVDQLDISMRDLTEGRKDWADRTVWEQFKNRGALAEVLASFEPLKHRYERLLDQWQRELESFRHEVGTLRRGLLLNVDPGAFAGLVTSQHAGVEFKNKLDQAADTTLGLFTLGAIGVGVAALKGAVAVGTIAAGPVGWIIAVPATAAVWKLFSHPQARRRKLVQTKRQTAEQRLRDALATQELNHDEMAEDLFSKFVQAASDQYAPLIIDARMAALGSKLEARVIQRVLSDTRRVIAG